MTPVGSSTTSDAPGRAWRWGRVLALAVVGSAGLLVVQTPPAPTLEPTAHSRQRHAEETRQRFEQAVVMLHAKQYEHAATALQRVLQLTPRMPEGHVNMGFAMLGLDRPGEAAAAFNRAIELKVNQANAYYGLALALEKQGDIEQALGAMRSYLHLSRSDDGYHAKARSAIWEWEQQLGRHPPSPPGTALPR